jgi:hypothetical protein
MSKSKEQRDALRATLKKLRDERGGAVGAATERNKLRQAVRKQVRGALVAGATTVPALAAATGLPTADVLWHLAAMRKYGDLVESGMDGGYCTYTLVAEPGGSQD